MTSSFLLYSSGHIPPHQRCGLVFFENEVALWRDVGAQELVDGAGDGVAEDGGVADEQLEVLFRVEEGRLDEDGGHGRAPQHREVGRRLDAAVWEALVDAADGAPERLLHRRRERVSPRVRAERIRFAAAAAAGIGVDRDEDIGGPAVGEARDIRVARRLAAQVVALHDLRLVAATLERDARILRDARIDCRLCHVVLAVDRAGVRTTAERVAWVDENSHDRLLSREVVGDRDKERMDLAQIPSRSY